MSFPTISSIKSNNAEEHEQGSVQGALYGARALAAGMGPLLFAQIFSAFTRSDSRLPFFPGAPFVIGAALLAGGVAVACSIPSAAGGSAGSLGGGSASRKLPERCDSDLGASADGSCGDLEGLSLLGGPPLAEAALAAGPAGGAATAAAAAAPAGPPVRPQHELREQLLPPQDYLRQGAAAAAAGAAGPQLSTQSAS